MKKLRFRPPKLKGMGIDGSYNNDIMVLVGVIIVVSTIIIIVSNFNNSDPPLLSEGHDETTESGGHDETTENEEESDIPEPLTLGADMIDSSIKLSLTLDLEFNSIGEPNSNTYNEFVNNFTKDVSNLINIDQERIIVNRILDGSMVIEFSIISDDSGTPFDISIINDRIGTNSVVIAGGNTVGDELITVLKCDNDKYITEGLFSGGTNICVSRDTSCSSGEYIFNEGIPGVTNISCEACSIPSNIRSGANVICESNNSSRIVNSNGEPLSSSESCNDGYYKFPGSSISGSLTSDTCLPCQVIPYIDGGSTGNIICNNSDDSRLITGRSCQEGYYLIEGTPSFTSDECRACTPVEGADLANGYLRCTWVSCWKSINRWRRILCRGFVFQRIL